MKEENTEEKPQGFRDSKGRAWIPKVNGLHVKNLEQKTGLGLFDAVFIAVEKFKGNDDQAAMSIIKNIFGSVWHAYFFVWDSSYKIGDDGLEISFDDFCGSIEKDQFTPLLKVSLDALLDYLPSAEEQGLSDLKKAKPAK